MPDLGYTREPMGDTAPEQDKVPEKRYPSISLEDANVEKVTGGDCKVDDLYYATVKLRVNSISDDDMGKRIGFDVLEMDEFEPADGGEDDAGEEEEAPPKNGKKTPKALRYS